MKNYVFFSRHGQNINVKCQMKTVAAEAPLCWLCLAACTHAHFGFVSVPAFSSSFQIAAPWNGICGPSGFLTMFQTLSCQMNSGVTSALLHFEKKKERSAVGISRESCSIFYSRNYHDYCLLRLNHILTTTFLQ